MKIRNIFAALLATSMLASPVLYAEETATSAKMLMYIHPQEYNSSVKLWQYYRDYWFTQGPIVEDAALRVMGKEFGDAAMCDSNQIASNVLVWLRPKIFYNPQMQMYHGKITAVAYTASGKPIATYVGEASKRGFLDVQAEKQIKEVYDNTMLAVADKMKADSNLLAAMNTPAVANETKTPCSMVTLLPPSKVQFMSF